MINVVSAVNYSQDLIALFESYTKKYGSVFTVYMGHEPLVILNDRETILDAFGRKAAKFAGREKAMPGTYGKSSLNDKGELESKGGNVRLVPSILTMI